MMKRTRKEVGVAGVAGLVLGMLFSVASAVMARTHPDTSLLLLFAAFSFHIPGGFMAVSHFGFHRGTKIYILVMFARSLMAIAAVLGFVSLASRPA